MCSPLPSAPLPLLSSPSSPPRCPELDLSLLHSPNPTHPKPKPHPPREIPCTRTTHQTSSKKTLGRTHRQNTVKEPPQGPGGTSRHLASRFPVFSKKSTLKTDMASGSNRGLDALIINDAMFQAVERELEEEKQRILRERKRHKEMAELEKKYEEATVRFEEPVVVKVTAEPGSSSSNLPSNNEHRSRGHRRRGRRHGEPEDHRACPPASVSNGECISSEVADCLLEEAEPNTLLALKAELLSLEGAEFNSQHAVQETLRSSVRTKNLINTKATEAVNFPPSQHLLSSLVSLSVEEDQLINQALRDRLPLAPPTRLHDNKTDGPSLLPFVNSVLFREMPLLGEEPGIKPRPQPTPRPAHSTFDLYRRHTQWQA